MEIVIHPICRSKWKPAAAGPDTLAMFPCRVCGRPDTLQLFMLKTLVLTGFVGMFVLRAWTAEPPSVADNARAGESRSPAEEDLMRPLADSWWGINRWSFQAGMGFITESSVGDLGLLRGELAEGEAGGEIYLLQVSYKATEWKPSLFGRRIEVDVELPLVLGIVDENHGGSFMQYSGGFALRCKTFPWNRWLYTNLETGIGLTYSDKVLATERERHPDRERSHLEFYWP